MSNLKSKPTLAILFGIAAMLFLLCPILLLARDTPAPNHPGSDSSANLPSSNVPTANAVSRVNPEGIGRNERLVSNFVAEMIERTHLSNHAVDDEISRRALGRYMKMLDPAKVYFLQSDVDEFSKWQNRLDDQLKSGDYTAAFEIFQRFVLRVDERTTDALALVDAEHDFSLDEEMIVGHDQADYAKDETEAREVWRKRIKYALLVQRSSQNDKEAGVQSVSEEILRKRYRTFGNRIHQLDNEDVIEQYISAITTSFDPHTNYLSKGTFDDFMIQMNLELEGIGATLRGDDEGYTVIQNIVEGGAAENQGGLKAEDKIIAVAQGKADGSNADPKLTKRHGIDFVDAVGMSANDVVGMIRGEAGKTVRLSVLSKDDSEIHTVQIVRQKIKLEDRAAQGTIFEEGRNADGSPRQIGVVELPMFYAGMSDANGPGRSTTTDVCKILEDFNDKGVDALVLDLRSNGGGSLQEAVDCTGLFIDAGPVVQVKDPSGRIEVLNDKNRGVAWSRPMIVLTSKFSASASEILAGAIQDYHRGLVVGDTATHGKGTVQNLMNISQMVTNNPNASNDFGALKLTIQQFYRPNGDSTQLRGVLADIVLPSITDKMDVSESDLDYPAEFDRVQRARFGTYAMTSPENIELLRSNSDSRRSESVEFKNLKKKIARYVEQKNLKSVSLNEEKFLASRSETNADSEDEKIMVDQMDSTSKIDRDFYMDEVLRITSDYAQAFSAN